MLTGDIKWGALSAAEAFVLPSHQENFGIAVAEALACGTPVLISNKINIWREIDGDGAGLVENDDLAGTSRLLTRWLATDGNARAAMSNNAQQCFANRFEIERATDSLLAAIAQHP
jgi:glycosyltransferase involved in cell wall biosynthesis